MPRKNNELLLLVCKDFENLLTQNFVSVLESNSDYKVKKILNSEFLNEVNKQKNTFREYDYIVFDNVGNRSLDKSVVLRVVRNKMVPISLVMAEVGSKRSTIGVLGTDGRVIAVDYLERILDRADFMPSCYSEGINSARLVHNNGSVNLYSFDESSFGEYSSAHFASFNSVLITDILLTNLNYHQTESILYEYYYKILSKLPRDSLIVACLDSSLSKRLYLRFTDRRFVTYSIKGRGGQYQYSYHLNGKVGDVILAKDLQKIAAVALSTAHPGTIGAIIGAIVTAIELGIDAQKAADSAKSLFSENSIDEYIQYPVASPNAIIEAISFAHEQLQRYPILIIRPYGFTRTVKLLDRLAEAIRGSKKVILLPILGEEGEKSSYVTNTEIVRRLGQVADVEIRLTEEEIKNYLQSVQTAKDVVFCFNCKL